MSKLILLIDDEIEAMKFYVMALRKAGYAVEQLRGPDAVNAYIQKQRPVPDVILLDIMLPPGKEYAQNPMCRDGTRTGVFFYPSLAGKWPGRPTIALTNLQDPDTLRQFGDVAPNVPLYTKETTPPAALVKLVAKTLA